MLEKADIQGRFGFHPGTNVGEDATIPKHETCRSLFMYVTTILNDLLPDGREKNITIEKLEDAAMWANKSIAQLAPVVPLGDGSTTGLVIVIENGIPAVVGDAKINIDRTRVEVEFFAVDSSNEYWGKDCVLVEKGEVEFKKPEVDEDRKT